MLLMRNVVLKCNRSCYLSNFGQENPPGLVPSHTTSPGCRRCWSPGQLLWAERRALGMLSRVQRVLPAGATPGDSCRWPWSDCGSWFGCSASLPRPCSRGLRSPAGFGSSRLWEAVGLGCWLVLGGRAGVQLVENGWR